MKIYTRKGDQGMTDLVGGKRVKKECTRLEAYGTVDELNSHMGLLAAATQDDETLQCLRDCQCVLFSMGAVLATDTQTGAHTMQTVTEQDVAMLETTIDRWSAQLPPWRGFVLPGGTEAAARAHVCRTVCRRAERCILALSRDTEIPAQVLCYMNRLSDLFFILAQRLNLLVGKDELLWQNHRHL